MSLALDADRTALLRDALQRLGEHASEAAVLGGGTVLAARWRHRISTDIDLFTTSDEWMRVRARLVEHLQGMTDLRIGVYPSMVSCELPDGGRFSFSGSDSVMADPLSAEFEATTGIGLHDTAEILARKIRARMVNSRSYLVRDAYDVVCARIYEPQALGRVLRTLEPQELLSLEYDGKQPSLPFDESQPLMRPTYPSLADAASLRKALFDALGRNSMSLKIESDWHGV